jgi:hypothetical protein
MPLIIASAPPATAVSTSFLPEALTVHARRERAEAVELHGLAFAQQVYQALHHFAQHQLAHLLKGDLAVLQHVLCQTLQVQGFLGVDLGEVLECLILP